MRKRIFLASLLAFLWTFACGVVWIWTGARNDATRWKTSMLCGFVAVLPGLLVAIAIFPNAAFRLVRGRSASVGAITFSLGTMFGGFIMSHMAWSIWLDHVYPHFFAHRKLPALRPLALAQLAIDALSDGVLNEGIAARVLARGPLVRSSLGNARREIPARLGSPLPAGARDGAWLPSGIQSVELETTEYAVVRRLTLQRLDELLRDERAAA